MWWGEMARNTHLSFSTQASAPLVEQITSSFRYGKDVYQVEYWKFQPYLILSISVWNSIWNGWSKCLVKKSVSLQLVDDHACEPWALWAGGCWEEKMPCAAWRFRVTHSFLRKGALMGDPSTNLCMEHSSLGVFLAWTREWLYLCAISD